MIGDINSIATALRLYGRYLIGIINNVIIVGIKDNQTSNDANYTIESELKKFGSLFPDYPRYFIEGEESFKDYFKKLFKNG